MGLELCASKPRMRFIAKLIISLKIYLGNLQDLLSLKRILKACHIYRVHIIQIRIYFLRIMQTNGIFGFTDYCSRNTSVMLLSLSYVYLISTVHNSDFKL